MKCECGAESVKDMLHIDWCPCHPDNQIKCDRGESGAFVWPTGIDMDSFVKYINQQGSKLIDALTIKIPMRKFKSTPYEDQYSHRYFTEKTCE